MPGVSVTATEVNTNISATTVTNESGYYTSTCGTASIVCRPS